MSFQNKIPTLAQWAGGLDKIKTLIGRFYEHVRNDDVIGPLFAKMSPEHAETVAKFINEVFGGGPSYTSGGVHSHSTMVAKHLGKHLSEMQRQRWVDLLLKTADEVGLASDPEFRSALVGYLEWGSRIAVNNSQSDINPIAHGAPMPKWGWGETGGPYLPEKRELDPKTK